MASIRRFAIGAILAIVIGAPVLETLDRWDQTIRDGNDTEINLVIGALCVGVALLFARAVLGLVRRSQLRCSLSPAAPLLRVLTLAAPIPNSRPPTSLRV